MRARLRLALVLLGLLAAGPASAAPLLLDFTYHGGLASSGAGTLDLGGGPVDLSGALFTVRGETTSSTPLTAITGILGVFAATLTYDFGALGSFTTDPGAARFTQVGPCWGACYGNDLRMDGQDFFWLMLAGGDPLVPAVEGLPYIPMRIFDAKYFVNAQHQALQLTDTSSWRPGSFVESDVQVTVVNPVPEPAPWILVGVGGMGLCWWARRRQQA